MDQDRRKAWGFSIFADDIRAEIGGKTTLVGIYQGDMIIQGAFPLAIPRFVAFISYYELRDALDTDITFRLSHGAADTTIAELSISRHDLKNQTPQSVADIAPEDTRPEDLERIFHLRLPLVMSPLLLPSGGRLRVRAHYSDGAILKMGSLGLRVFTPEQFKEFLEKGAQPEPLLN